MAPTVVSPGANRTIAALQGDSVTLNFQIINANPSVTADQIEWYFNDTMTLRYLTTLYGNTLAFSRDFRTLTISNLNYDIAGRISVTALNLVGSSNDYVNLIIEGTLMIIRSCVITYIIMLCVYQLRFTKRWTFSGAVQNAKVGIKLLSIISVSRSSVFLVSLLFVAVRKINPYSFFRCLIFNKSSLFAFYSILA